MVTPAYKKVCASAKKLVPHHWRILATGLDDDHNDDDDDENNDEDDSVDELFIYLHTGIRSNIRHHYRASKMALWLDLIPRLHKSDDLDPRFHHLENSSDRSTFEEEGTRDLDFETHTQETTSKLIGGTQRPLSTLATSFTSRRWLNSSAATRGRRTTWVPSPPAPHGEHSTPIWVVEQPRLEVDSANSSLLSLRVTIGIGSTLLVLNLLIFAGLCYQKERVRREMRMGTRFLDHLLRGKANQDLHAQHQDVYSVRPTPGDLPAEIPADSNGGAGVPLSISMPRHQLVMQSSLPQETGVSGGGAVQQHNMVQRGSPSEGPYTMVLSRCLVSSCPAATTTLNHVDCRDGLLLKYLPTPTTTIDLTNNGSDEQHCTNPSTFV